MFRRKQFIKSDQFGIILFIFVPERLIIIPKIKPCKTNFSIHTGHEWLGYLIVEKVSGLTCKPSFFKIIEMLNQFLILSENLFKKAGIKHKPFKNICCNEMLNLKVFIGNSFPQVIKDQLMKSFSVHVINTDHLSFIRRQIGR